MHQCVYRVYGMQTSLEPLIIYILQTEMLASSVRAININSKGTKVDVNKLASMCKSTDAACNDELEPDRYLLKWVTLDWPFSDFQSWTVYMSLGLHQSTNLALRLS
jgi:hypothetical protein